VTDKPELATSSIPILTWNGSAWIGCDAAVHLLRSIAVVVESSSMPTRDVLDTLVESLRIEADNLECRAIAHTTEPK
jgi:hypothetical protein